MNALSRICFTGRRGYTLAELMITILIIGIVAVASTPAIGRFVQTWRLNGETDSLVGFMRGARSAAVSKNVTAIFRLETASNSYYYFEDRNGNGLHDANEYRSATVQLGNGIVFTGYTLSGPIVVFGPQGNTNESGTVTLENRHNGHKEILIYGGTGNITIQ